MSAYKPPKFSPLWPEQGSEPATRRHINYWAVKFLTGPRAYLFVHFKDEEDARAFAIQESDAGVCVSLIAPGT